MDLTIYKDSNPNVGNEDVIKNIEGGTMLDREKKKKKNKKQNRDTNKHKEIDEDKIKEEAKQS